LKQLNYYKVAISEPLTTGIAFFSDGRQVSVLSTGHMFSGIFALKMPQLCGLSGVIVTVIPVSSVPTTHYGQDQQSTFQITLTRVRVTVVAVEK
jgi:hypothetical protein